MTAKAEGLSGFYFINPNGIRYQQGLADFYVILQSLWDNSIDVYGLPETNLDRLKPEIRKCLEDISQDFYSTSILVLSTSSLRSHTPLQTWGHLDRHLQ